MSKSLKEQVEEIKDALSERVEWENELGRGEAQRKMTDRSKINNHPWPRSSNVKSGFTDTEIARFTPFLFKILYSSERVAYFRSMSQQNATFGGLVADWFDFKVKNYTDLEEEIQPCTDKLLQDGETVMKVMWNDSKQCFYFEHVDNLFFITPSNVLRLKDSPWCVHVLQKSKKWILKRYKHINGIEGFVNRVQERTVDDNDSNRRSENEYVREGISISPKNRDLVLWEKHYRDDEGKHRIVILSPDEPSFDFEDDRPYPYELGDYMFEHTKWEKIDKKMHSARGLPRLLMEADFTLTALERFKHNLMTLTLTPLLYAQGSVPGSTQNISFAPGTFLPFPVEVVKMGTPGFEIDQEIQRTLQKWERRVGMPDYTLNSAQNPGENRTATEVKAIGFQNNQAVDLITGNWRMFLAKIFKKAWKYVVLAKPESLTFFLDGKNQTIPPEALNDEWQITISGTAESVNREAMTQRAITLWQMCQNNPFANLGEAWKNVLQNLSPGEVDRFYQDPTERQQEQKNKTTADIGTMISTGAFMSPEPEDDLVTAGVTAMQYLVKEQQRLLDPQLSQAMQGTPQASPQAVNLITQYIATCREMLKSNNKQGFAQLNQALNQIEMEAQQMGQAMQQQAIQQQGLSLPPPPSEAPPVNSVSVSPTKKEIRKNSTIIRNPDGTIAAVNTVGVEVSVDENGNVIDTDEMRQRQKLIKNDQGKILASQGFGVQG